MTNYVGTVVVGVANWIRCRCSWCDYNGTDIHGCDYNGTDILSVTNYNGTDVHGVANYNGADIGVTDHVGAVVGVHRYRCRCSWCGRYVGAVVVGVAPISVPL